METTKVNITICLLHRLAPELQTMVGSYLDPRLCYILAPVFPAMNLRNNRIKKQVQSRNALPPIPPIQPTEFVHGCVVMLSIIPKEEPRPRSYILRYVDGYGGENPEFMYPVELAYDVGNTIAIIDSSEPYNYRIWLSYEKSDLGREALTRNRNVDGDMEYVEVRVGDASFSGWHC